MVGCGRNLGQTPPTSLQVGVGVGGGWGVNSCTIRSAASPPKQLNRATTLIAAASLLSTLSAGLRTTYQGEARPLADHQALRRFDSHLACPVHQTGEPPEREQNHSHSEYVQRLFLYRSSSLSSCCLLLFLPFLSSSLPPFLSFSLPLFLLCFVSFSRCLLSLFLFLSFSLRVTFSPSIYLSLSLFFYWGVFCFFGWVRA